MTYPAAIVAVGFMAFMAYMAWIFICWNASRSAHKVVSALNQRIDKMTSTVLEYEAQVKKLSERIQSLENKQAFEKVKVSSPFGP